MEPWECWVHCGCGTSWPRGELADLVKAYWKYNFNLTYPKFVFASLSQVGYSASQGALLIR